MYAADPIERFVATSLQQTLPSLQPPDPDDRRWMREALSLARVGYGRTWPNPSVGSVVVRDGRVIGRGYHPGPGQPHAEIYALREAGEAARGADLYVTLEPCSHYGRTPPCTEAIVAAGIRRVVAAIPDPFPEVRGRGFKRLLEAGIAVTVGVEAAAAVRLNEPFLALAARGRPWVVYKYATSLDGKVATRTGDARWISGEPARREVHRLRAALPAIMAGVGTVLADDPLLTARDEDGRPLERQPLRVIVDSGARTPPTAALLSQPGETLIACTGNAPASRVNALRRAGARVERLPADERGRVHLPSLMNWLGGRGIVGMLLEGGGTLAGAMLQAGLIDELIAYVAPLLIGGQGAPTPLGGDGAATLSGAWRLHEWEWTTVGDDRQVRARFQPLLVACQQYFAFAAAQGSRPGSRRGGE